MVVVVVVVVCVCMCARARARALRFLAFFPFFFSSCLHVKGRDREVDMGLEDTQVYMGDTESVDMKVDTGDVVEDMAVTHRRWR